MFRTKLRILILFFFYLFRNFGDQILNSVSFYFVHGENTFSPAMGYLIWVANSLGDGISEFKSSHFFLIYIDFREFGMITERFNNNKRQGE